MALTGVINEPEHRQVLFAADLAVARAAALKEESERIRASARTLAAEARRLRRRRAHPAASPAEPTGAPGEEITASVGFRLRGVIDGADVTAEWTAAGLDASEALLVRADLVVRLGETFVGADGSELAASLEAGVTRALLTLMRACDQVESVSMTIAPPGEPSRSG